MSVKQMNPFGKKPKKSDIWGKKNKGQWNPLAKLDKTEPWKTPRGKKNPWKW